jgi:hypothetical protein
MLSVCNSGSEPCWSLHNALRLFANRPCIGSRVAASSDAKLNDESPYQWMTYAEGTTTPIIAISYCYVYVTMNKCT